MARVIPQKDCLILLGCLYHIPKKLRVLVLREMEILGMLKRLNTRDNSIEIFPILKDIEEDCRELSEQLKIY